MKILELNRILSKRLGERIHSLTSEFKSAFDINYNIDFSILSNSTTFQKSDSLFLSPNASVFYDKIHSDSKTKKFHIFFTSSLVFEIYWTYNFILSSNKTLHHIGDSQKEETPHSSNPIPKDSLRKEYAKHLAALAFEFVFYHEFSHIIYGHLSKVFTDYEVASLYTVNHSNNNNKHQIARELKTYELDADVNAIVFIMNELKKGDLLLNFSQYKGKSSEELFFNLGLAITILFRVIECWRRVADPIYSSTYNDHPHPDIRDSIITAYLRVNSSLDEEENKQLHKAYDRGRENAINIIADLDYFIPTFEITKALGYAEVGKELMWISDELNLLRNKGVCDMDLRVLYRNFKQKKKT